MAYTADHHARIVVVDDEKVLGWAIGMLLSKAGYEVVTFQDPRLALTEMLQSVPDLVVSDVVMPGLSGIDLAIQLQRQQPGIKTLLLSGQANTLKLLDNARAQGFDFEVYPKPIAPQELLRLIAAQLDLSRQQVAAA